MVRQGAVTCVKTLPWYFHSDIGTTSDPKKNIRNFWDGTEPCKEKKKRIHASFNGIFVAAIQICVIYSFTPPIFIHETSLWLWYLTYQSLMILNLVPCNIVLRTLSQNHLVDTYNSNLNFSHCLQLDPVEVFQLVSQRLPIRISITRSRKKKSIEIRQHSWGNWSYHLSPSHGSPAWSEDSAWIHR